VRTFWILIVISAASLVAFLWRLNSSDEASPWLAVVFSSSAVLGLAWLVLMIRCPSCSGRVAWWVVTRERAGSWVATLARLQQCPICGHRGH
jgi:hypothetical protein